MLNCYQMKIYISVCFHDLTIFSWWNFTLCSSYHLKWMTHILCIWHVWLHNMYRTPTKNERDTSAVSPGPTPFLVFYDHCLLYNTETSSNWTALGPSFVFRIDRCSVYTGLTKISYIGTIFIVYTGFCFIQGSF
jgi:hypothetical protein